MIYEALIILRPTNEQSRAGSLEEIVAVLPPFVAANEDGAKTAAILKAAPELSKIGGAANRVEVLLRPFARAS